MAKKQSQSIKGCRKGGRSKIKAAGRTSALSLFVRGKIDAGTYFKQTGQTVKV